MSPKKRERVKVDLEPSVVEEISRGERQANKRRGRPADPKAAWKQTNIRMDPTVKYRLKARARALGVPAEELVHVALAHYLDHLDGDEVPLEPKTVATRRTLLPIS